MTALPEDGELRLGEVRLPPGRRVRAREGPNEPVAWVTDEPVESAGRAWLALSGMAAATGLQPMLQVTPDWIPEYLPEEDFYEPYAVDDLDDMNAADILAALWEGRTWGAGDPRAAAQFRPYSGEFPGLAPPAAGPPLTKEETERVLGSLPPAHVCLVAAGRPADVLTVTGWQVSDAWDSPLLVSAVLRSWEDRFGARLLQLGPSAEIRLLVDRPARTLAAAQAVAAEAWAFGHAWIDQEHSVELTALSDIAPQLLNAPVWAFWWD